MFKLLLILLLFSIPLWAVAEENAPGTVRYHSDFTTGADGWYARSTGGAMGFAADGVYTLTGRTSDWHSPGHDFALSLSGQYALQVQIRQDTLEQATFKLSVAHRRNGVETYENLAEATVRKGEWTTLSAVYLPTGFESYTFYVETAGAPDVSFSIRDFALVETAISFPRNLPSLKEAAAPLFDFGTAVTRAEVLDPKRMDFYASQFSIMTPCNELKPEAVLDLPASCALAKLDNTAVAVHFDAAAPLLDFARARHIKIHGHTLIWHNQTPEAFFHDGYDLAQPLSSRETMLARLESYIRQVMTYLDEQYPGVIVSWDVANEVIDDNTGKLRNSLWLQTVGDDYVHRAFALARRYAPKGTLLYLNDYNSASEPKLTGLCDLLDSLIAEGNIDGYGFQMHHSVEKPTIAKMENALRRVAAKGIKLRVSEMDLTMSAYTEANLHWQAQRYGDIIRMLRPYAGQLTAVQVWGVTDSLSWRASGYPLLFDESVQPKEAFWSVLRALKNE